MAKLKAEKLKFEFLKAPQPFYFGKNSFAYSKYYPMHQHDTRAEIIILKKGTVKIRSGENTYNLGSNTIFVFNPKFPHEEFYSGENGEFYETYHLTMGNYLLNGEYTGAFIPGDYPFYTVADKKPLDEVTNLIQQLENEYNEKKLGYTEIIHALCTEICIRVLRIFDAQYSIYQERSRSEQQISVMDVKSFIDENYTDKRLSLEEIERRIHLSKYYISRLFKSSMGVSVYEYLISVRMEKSRVLLKDTNLTVVQIAKKTGYDNIYQFHRQFKRRYNCTPLEYRKSLEP